MDKNDISRIIEMAWEDRTPFDAIEKQFGLNEDALKKLMRKNMKDQLGNQFDIRDFHDAVLKEGAMPLNILEAHIHWFVTNKENKK